MKKRLKKPSVRVVRKKRLAAAVYPPSFSYQTRGPRRSGGTVHRVQRALAIERNWRKKRTDFTGDHYEGYFHAAGMKFRGKATVSRSDIDIWIKDPPQELRRHRHWECFFRKKNGWYWIHHTEQAGLNSAILEIEAILTECRPRNHPVQRGRKIRQRRRKSTSGGIVGQIIKFLTELTK